MSAAVLRRCVACREMKAKSELWRVVKTAEGAAFDKGGKAEGRGAYVCKRADCVGKAEKRRAFERSLNAAVPAAVYSALRDASENPADAVQIETEFEAAAEGVLGEEIEKE